MNYPRITLKKGREKSLLRFHPWIFSGAIEHISREIKDGEVAEVTDKDGNFLALAHFQNSGSITGRVISRKNEAIDEAFFKAKLQQAWDLRKTANLARNENTNVFRWVFAEGDGLPGLIIDKYKQVAVIQCHTAGMFNNRELIAKAISGIEEAGIEAVYDKSKEFMSPGLEKEGSYLSGSNINEIVMENGLLFRADWEKGQKTGFFIDQRDNRQLVKHYSRNKTVLNTFSYTGGFSVYALAGGAKTAFSVDISKRAIDLANENAALNKLESNHTGVAADVFDYLKSAEKDEFDLIILDPPAFAKSQRVTHNAIQGYKRLNIAAMEKIASGGLLFTFSCSQVIDPVTFNKTIFSAAIEAGREARILHYLSQPADHPVNIFHPEGQYLKGLVLQII